MSEHAFLPPSSAASWVKCAMWPHMNARYPELGDSSQSSEGTGAHWAASEMLLGREVVVGQVAPNGVVIDNEMIDAAWLYCDDVDTASGQMVVEQRVAIPYVHELNWGTPDCYKWDANSLTLTVWDFKYGFGYVEVYENWQLIDYVCGITQSVSGVDDERITVDMRVVQPRSYHREGPVRKHVVKLSDLRAKFNILKNAAAAVMSPEPRAMTGKHCEYCPGRHACPELQKAALNAADIASIATPFDLPASAIGRELRYLSYARELLDARVSGLEEETLAKIRRGERVPFFTVEQSMGRLAWNCSNETVFALGHALGVDLRKAPEPLTPTQAKKLLPEAIIEMNASRPKGEMKLIEVQELTAQKIFGLNKE